MTASAYNNGVSESRAYNSDNMLASISFTGAPIGNLSYGWDANKNKTSETIGGTMSGYGFAVGGSGCDDEDRLVNWQRSDSNLNQSWSLSLVGDWNSITTNGTPQSRTHGPAHEMLTAAGQNVTRDVKGNTTLIPAALRPSGSTQLKLKWDFDNRLSAADSNNDNTDDVFYRFDALGRRVARNDGTNHTIFFQDGQQTIADYPAGAAPASPTYTYIYASYIDEPVMRSGTGGLRYYHRNQQYSIVALTDGSGVVAERYAYSAYGQVTFANAAGTPQAASASNNRYTYTGREWDPGLKLYHYRARMYDPIGGRFVSRDPIGYEGNLLGLYGYGPSNPCSGMDPNGEIWFVPVIVVLGILVTPTLLDDPEIDGTHAGSHDDQRLENITNLITLVGGATAIKHCTTLCLSVAARHRAIADATARLSDYQHRLFRWAQRAELLEARLETARRGVNGVQHVPTVQRLEMELGRAIERRMELQGIVDQLRRVLECLR